MSTLMNCEGWQETIDIDMLSKVETPSLGSRHVPANHGVVLKTFRDMVERNGVKPVSEKGILSPDRMKYINMIEVQDKNVTDFNFTFGFINYNNKQKSLTMLAGERVFVCNNGMVSGEIESTKRKHTGGLYQELEDRFAGGFDKFHEFRQNRLAEINDMKGFPVNDSKFGLFVLQLHRHSCIGNTNITRVVQEWDRPSFEYDNGGNPRNAWNLQNACTYVFDNNIANPLQRVELNKETRSYIAEIMGR